MNEKERKLLRNAIVTRLDRLRIILDAHISELAPEDEPEKDESARLDGLSSRNVDQTLVDIARIEKNQLQSNLEWIDTDDAGNCVECEKKIPFQRLITIPTTRHCVECADFG